MIGISENLIKRLFRYGMSNFFRIGQNILNLINATGKSIDSSVDYLNGIFDESIAETITELSINDWCEAYGIQYDTSIGFDANKATIVSMINSSGGQSVDYITDAIQSQFPAVFLTETGACAVLVEGSVLNFNDYARLQGQVQRILPINVDVSYDIYLINEQDIAIAGKAIAGKALTGKITP